jgi:ABC-2 type transport system permease protein
MSGVSDVEHGEERFSGGERLLTRCLSAFCVGIVLATTILMLLGAFGIGMAGGPVGPTGTVYITGNGQRGPRSAAASLAKGRREAAMVIFPLVLYPAILLGGIVLPIASIPDYLLPISYLVPLTYPIDGVRLSMLNGFGWGISWVQVAALIAQTISCMAISLLIADTIQIRSTE